MNDDLRQGVRELLAEVAVQIDRADREEAKFFVAVSFDPATKAMHAYGPHDSPEAALIEAEKMRADMLRHLDPGDRPWEHYVVPVF